MPDLTYRERLLLDDGERPVELFAAPGETHDGTAVWVPDVRALYGANALINVCPNAGSPYRILRDPQRWADTLDGFRALDPLLLIPEFGKPLTDTELISRGPRSTGEGAALSSPRSDPADECRDERDRHPARRGVAG